jgi:DNA repair exonuclease SbcCD ATPase subunit
MKSKLYLFTIIMLLIFGTIKFSKAQISLKTQYENIVEKANNYQEYKVINQTQIKNLWKNTTDTLKSKQAKLNQAQSQLKNQQSEINQLKKLLAEKDDNLTSALNAKDEILLLGFIPLSKTSYQTTMWGLIILLASLSAFLIFRTKGFRNEAVYRTKLFNDLNDEFKNFKIKANDNEKKLARALQDERNKLDELYRR